MPDPPLVVVIDQPVAIIKYSDIAVVVFKRPRAGLVGIPKEAPKIFRNKCHRDRDHKNDDNTSGNSKENSIVHF